MPEVYLWLITASLATHLLLSLLWIWRGWKKPAFDYYQESFTQWIEVRDDFEMAVEEEQIRFEQADPVPTFSLAQRALDSGSDAPFAVTEEYEWHPLDYDETLNPEEQFFRHRYATTLKRRTARIRDRVLNALSSEVRPTAYTAIITIAGIFSLVWIRDADSRATVMAVALFIGFMSDLAANNNPLDSGQRLCALLPLRWKYWLQSGVHHRMLIPVLNDAYGSLLFACFAFSTWPHRLMLFCMVFPAIAGLRLLAMVSQWFDDYGRAGKSAYRALNLLMLGLVLTIPFLGYLVALFTSKPKGGAPPIAMYMSVTFLFAVVSALMTSGLVLLWMSRKKFTSVCGAPKKTQGNFR